MTEITSPDGTRSAPLAFGTMQFGSGADESAARAMFHACLDRGVTHFDTAHTYNDGASEEMLGRLAQGQRDRLILATKANFGRGNGAASIRESCEESLARMGVEVIDLYYLHRFDPDVPLEESFEGLAALKSEGKIRNVGVSNFAAWQVMKAQAVARSLGIAIDAIQPMLNLVKRQAEVEILPMAMDQDMAVYPYSPLGGGLLTGKYRAGVTGRLTENDMYRARYGAEWMHNTAADLATLARAQRVDPSTLAVAWAMARPGVTAPLISGRSVEQLLPSLMALEAGIDHDLMARITALTRTPPPATDRLEEV